MIAIRSLTAADHDAVRAIDIAEERAYLGAAWDRLSSEEQERQLSSGAEEFAIHLGSGFSLVAEEGEEVVGFLFAFRPMYPLARLYVGQITVSAEYRRQGVAKALYDELISRARAAGIKDLRAHINLDNEPSQRLHESAGFRLVERFQATLEL